MIKVQYANAMAEVLHYLKGIRQEDIDKIPRKFMIFLEENASKDYICNFDYNKSLRDIKVLDETRGIIGTICLNYWCVTDEQKEIYLSKLQENEKSYQEELREKYNLDNIFKDSKIYTAQNSHEPMVKETAMIEYKEPVLSKIINWIKELFHNKKQN